MDSLVNSIRDFCIERGFAQTYWLGLSGGLDSTVLLHLFAQLRKELPLKIKAVYVNHGLNAQASHWEKHCASLCEKLAVDFQSCAVNIKPSKQSLEESAREYRYSALKTLMYSGDILLTGHHQDDQAETVLLQLLRGAGPKGLAAMPVLKSFGAGLHARPLLNFSRETLKKYAEMHQLEWIEDDSNFDTALTRNFLRHDIFPVFKKNWPTVTATLARVADNCAQAQQLLDEYVFQELEQVTGSLPNTLSIKKLSHLSILKQRYVLRAWLQQLHFPIPSAIKLQQIQKDMLMAAEDKSPQFAWRGIELRRYRDDLFVLPKLSAHDAKQILIWKDSQSLVVPNIGTLTSTQMLGQGLRLSGEAISVRFRQQGEELQLPGRNCHHSLKKLFQEWNVPPWQRDRVPLIFVEDKLAAVVGYAINHEFMVEKNQTGACIQLLEKKENEPIS